MKRIIICVGLLICAIAHPLLAQAQEEKPRVAIFDPAGTAKNMDESMAVVVREMVSSAIVNTGKYNIVERSLIDRVLKEQKFSNSGAVDESQVSAIGKLAGADKVVLSVFTSAGTDKVMLSLKIIDVESASVESQKIKVVKSDDLLDEITPLALALVGEEMEVETKKEEESKGSSFPGLFDKGSKKAEPEKPKTKSESTQKEAFVERNNNTITSSFSSSPQTQSREIVLEFPGFTHGKNPSVQVFVDGQLVGNGNLNQGFVIRFTDNRPGKHTVKAEWSDTVNSKTYTINTASKQHYIFEYKKTGFGYAFQLKN
jgi:hypothetical protein